MPRPGVTGQLVEPVAHRGIQKVNRRSGTCEAARMVRGHFRAP